MNGLLTSFWAQLGAVGLLMISGWVVAVVVYRDMKKECDRWRIDSQARMETLQEVVVDNTKAMALLAERLSRSGR